MCKAIVSLVFAFAVAAPAVAGPISASVLDSDDRAWFYNRPGATAREVSAAHGECLGFGAAWVGQSDGRPVVSPYGLTGDVLYAIVSAGLVVQASDECMIAKGFRRFDVLNETQRPFLQRLAAMPAEQQAAYFGAETPPEGVQARVWVNDYWLGDSAGRAPERSYTPRLLTVAEFNRYGAVREIDAVEDFSAIAPDPDAAVVFMTMRAPANRAFVLFDRRDPVTGHPSRVDFEGRNRFVGFEAETQAPDGSPNPERIAFVIPPGTYALAMARSTRHDGTFFCMGTVAFSINAGEVLDLGEFTLERGDRVVDPLSPPPQVRFRIDQPEVDAGRVDVLGATTFAGTLRAATYFNGFPRMCSPFLRFYGVDMPGAPLWTPPAQ